MVYMAKREARHMASNKSGNILIVSSLSATLPIPYEMVYGPSKAFGFMFAEALREELKEHYTNVTAMLPGTINIDFRLNAGMDTTYFGKGSNKDDKEIVSQQGYEGPKNKVNHIVCSDVVTKKEAKENREKPEEVKASRHTEKAKLQ